MGQAKAAAQRKLGFTARLYYMGFGAASLLWFVFYSLPALIALKDTILIRDTFLDLDGRIRCCFCESSLVKLLKHQPYDSSNPELFKDYLTEMTCNACDETIDYFPDVFEQCIKDYFFADAYISATQGGMPPYEDCPECGKGTFVFDEMCCVACDYTLEYQNCARCHQSIGLEEQDLGGLCSYCSNLAYKIRNE